MELRIEDVTHLDVRGGTTKVAGCAWREHRPRWGELLIDVIGRNGPWLEGLRPSFSSVPRVADILSMHESRPSTSRTQSGAKPQPRDVDPRAEADALLERVRQGETELPVLPDTAAAVLAACRNDDSGPRQIALALERDPGLAAELLRVANSAAYSAGGSVVSLHQAIGRLGMSAVATITTAVAVKGRVFSVPRFASEVAQVWSHSASASAWAREIARQRRRNVEGAFLCGLMHDVGRPLMLQAFAKLEAGGARFDPAALAAAVDDLHPHIGAELVMRWGLPAWAADSVRWHGDPWLAVDHRDEALTTALASHLAHGVLGDALERDEIKELALRDELGLYPEDFEELLARREHVLEVAAALT